MNCYGCCVQNKIRFSPWHSFSDLGQAVFSRVLPLNDQYRVEVQLNTFSPYLNNSKLADKS